MLVAPVLRSHGAGSSAGYGYIQDTFTRGDTTSGLGSAETGEPWTVLGGTMGIASNKAYGVGGQAWSLIETGWSDVDISVVCGTVNASSMGVLFRYSTSGNGMEAVFWSGGMQLLRYVGGVQTVLGSASGVVSGDTIRVVADGPFIVALKNGSVVLRVLDSSNLTNTKHGITAVASNSIDSFRVDPIGASNSLTAVDTAQRAYSIRQGRFYSGNCVLLRRSSDNAEQAFGFSGGELDWAAVDAWRGAATAYVKTWFDQSGSTDLSQTTAGSQPSLDTVNKRIVGTVGTGSTAGRHMKASWTAISQPWTLACVCLTPSIGAASTADVIIGSSHGNSTNIVALYMDTTAGRGVYAGTNLTNAGTTTGLQQIAVAANGASSQLWANGSSLVTGNAGTAGIQSLGLNVLNYDGTDRRSSGSEYKEVLLWSRNAVSELDEVFADQDAAYSIP
jgi:hypothetical protein